MRSKKCYGLLLALPIMFGLSLSVCSDTNALKYAYNSFPLYVDNFYYCNTGGDDCTGYTWHGSQAAFQVFFDASSSLSYDSDLTDLSKASYVPCFNYPPDQVSDLRNIFSANYTNSYHYFSFGSGSLLKSQWSSLPSKTCFDNASVWSYDSIYSASYNLSNGDTVEMVDLSSLYFDNDDPSYDSASIKKMVIPLNLNSDSLRFISSGTLLEWDFGIVQKSANNFVYLDENLVADMNISYFTLDNLTSSSSDFFNSYKSSFSIPSTVYPKPSCTVDTNYIFTARSNELWEDYLGFNVHCSFTAPSDMYYIYPILTLYGSSGSSVNPSVFLTYDYHHPYFTGSYLVTDGDSSWSGQYANNQPTGEDLENAPGYHQLFGYDNNFTCSDGDWLCNLTNLFTFNVINPFYPIYSLFTDNNSCADIPIIAGMLHSNETTICPWFDSQTLNIMTPVIGLASSMLLFGFVVRWLGSRSGNFVEDSVNADNIDIYDGRNFGSHSMIGRFRRHK